MQFLDILAPVPIMSKKKGHQACHKSKIYDIVCLYVLEFICERTQGNGHNNILNHDQVALMKNEKAGKNIA